MKYKYKIGDKLKIIRGGVGFHPKAEGQIITVAELGLYFGQYPGYKPIETFPYDLFSGGLAGEESFELYESAKFIPQIFN